MVATRVHPPSPVASRRSFFFSVLAGACVLSLVACSGGEDSEPPSGDTRPTNGEGGAKADAILPDAAPSERQGTNGEAGGRIRGKIESRIARMFPAAVYLEKRAQDRFLPADEVVTIDQKDQAFVPRVLVIRAGSSVEFRNSDTIRHNVHTEKSPKTFDQNTAPGEKHEESFDAPGVVTVKCHFHSTMIAYVVVVETPYHATTDAQGAFVIEDVPPGEYRISFWHEKLEPATKPISVLAGRDTEVVFQP